MTKAYIWLPSVGGDTENRLMVEGVDVENLHTQVLEQGFTGAFWFNGHAQVINLSLVTDIAFVDED
ncbi:hypothetical protein GCM10007416_00390 [Kroppenstedtia guangzhouensis]|uniref:Uncharacterized protein n=1 Tax=Kroppenstedtia guangzhouensis TaxID=1274356 RepID=A0ABQ1FVA5_9BACL|nr:hypothetical protein [Kroppenstedtia guangzhouensis]GGA31798.1 hypothetical protein GCM10007416_00390 [Kroppenstedtia guangzhouensis]